MFYIHKKHYIRSEGNFLTLCRVCKKDGTVLLMNQGLSGVVEFHYWENAISAKNLCNMAMFTNRNWEKLVKQLDF